MNSVYAWSGTLCAVLVISSLIRIISPSEKTLKTMNLIIGVFVILAVTSPLVSFVKNLEFKDASYEYFTLEEDVTKNYNTRVLRETGNYLVSYCKELLDSSKIEYKNIEVLMEKDEDRGIYVKECRIYMDKDRYLEEKDVKELISSSLLIEPRIIYEQ